MSGADFLNMIEAFGFDSQPDIRLGTGGEALVLDSAEINLSEELIGQGQIIVSPLQAARAFSAMVNGGNLPALQIVKSVSSGAVDSETFSELDERRPVLTEDLSDNLSAELRLPDSTHIEVVAVAIGGGKPQEIIWYLGARERGGRLEVVVVALENATAQRTIQTGRSLLNAD